MFNCIAYFHHKVDYNAVFLQRNEFENLRYNYVTPYAIYHVNISRILFAQNTDNIGFQPQLIPQIIMPSIT